MAQTRGNCGEKKRLEAGDHLQEQPQELRDSAKCSKKENLPKEAHPKIKEGAATGSGLTKT